MSYPIIDTATKPINSEDESDIKQAILNAELDTSAEIRVHLEETCPGDVMDRANKVFEELNMRNTQKRNGVLFYLAIKNRKFAVISDEGISIIGSDYYWNDLKLEMLDYFRENKFTEGLIYGIGRTGEFLKSMFPYQKGDTNELSDDISFG